MNGACIVETRAFANLDKLIIDHHLKYIPKDWGLTIYCSHQNHHLIKDVDFERETEIIVMQLPFGVAEYNLLFKTVRFWESLPYEKVLIFQTDSRLLREGIEDFLEWDYVGAKWLFQEQGGNGGLSIRNVNIMRKICQLAKFTTRNEDVLFCNFMHLHKIGKLAPPDICRQFSVEAEYGLGSLGCHGIDNWLTKEQCDKILNQYNKK